MCLLIIKINKTMETTNTTPAKKVRRTATIPAKDIDFGKVTKSVADKWATESWLTLRWTTQANFATLQDNYKNTLEARQDASSGRPQVTKALEILNTKIDAHLLYVKNYIIEKYKKDAAESYYPAFGIEHKGNRFLMPIDQNKRLAALRLMITGLDTNGFNGREFGASFWTDIKTEFEQLISTAATTDSNVTTQVSSKNDMKAQLKKVLNAIIFALKANYPDTYSAEIRTWGMQKEKY